MTTLQVWLIFVVGIVIGSAITSFIWDRKKVDGVLEIDQSNPKKDKYLFKVDTLDGLASKNYIVMKIKVLNQTHE